MIHLQPLAFVALLAMAAPSQAWAAIAGQPDPADVRAVEACVQDAKAKNASPESCIGVVARSCQSSAQTVQANEACEQREEEVWNAAVARDYARLATALENAPGARQALRDAETGYERAKLGLCSFERIARRNTPDGLLAASTCRRVATGRQDLWLADQFDQLTKK